MFQTCSASTPIFEFDSTLLRSVTQDFGQLAAITTDAASDFVMR